MLDAAYQRLRAIENNAKEALSRGSTRIADREQAQEILWLIQQVRGLNNAVFELREQIEEDQSITHDRLAKAWQDGFKQGGPMHDVNYDDPDAHTRNPYKALS